ncbi:MAG: hypothetical protein Q4C52_05285 [Eubacteriales bacterium]|nr:hypothetical protein [Eubacteriales bacterium]
MEIELYELNASIASNCAVVVSNGPAVGNHEQCDDYEDPFAMSTYSMQRSGPYNVQFYEDTNCDCYYSSSDYGYWTS